MTELNSGQRTAVAHFQGPMLVLAGPGSGKTRVITERIHHLIAERGVSPSEILVITFTRLAAAQMRRRYQELYSQDSAGVRFGTFHSIFFMILKHAYHYNSENIVREEVRRGILQELIRREDLEIQDEKEFLGDLEAEISRVKGERLDLEHYYSPLCPEEKFREIFRGYQRALERRRLLDFDDMQVYCLELLSQREDVLKIWQQQFRYILVDEFQDICLLQYDIVKMLAAPEDNLFIVGDDDQSIYGFRGARPGIMKQFLQDYPQAQRCLLGVNYRCAAPIVEAAGRLIAQNQNRMEKQIQAAKLENAAVGGEEVRAAAGKEAALGEAWAVKNPRTGEEVVSVSAFETVSRQNEGIRERILAGQRAGIPLGEMAVLYRTNTQARGLSLKLAEWNIPFAAREGIPCLYDHWMAQDVLTYVKVAQGSRERGDVLRIINKPGRYVHRSALSEPVVDLAKLQASYRDRDWMAERIGTFQRDLSLLAGMKPYAAVNYIRRGIGYDEYVKEYAEYRGISAEGLWEVLEELQEEARGYQTFPEWFAGMEEYRRELSEQSRRDQEKGEAVQLLTMHGAKGLEYTTVFIPDANEGVTPHSKSVLPADMEEERRMFYVAMTRAKEHLHISYTAERFHREVERSRFVRELT